MCACEEDDSLKQGLINIGGEREVKQMNTIGIALISFGIGLIISWKLAERDRKNAKKKSKNRE